MTNVHASYSWFEKLTASTFYVPIFERGWRDCSSVSKIYLGGCGSCRWVIRTVGRDALKNGKSRAKTNRALTFSLQDACIRRVANADGFSC